MNQKRGIALMLAAIFLVLYYALVWGGYSGSMLIIDCLALVVAPILCVIGFILAMLKD